MPFLKGNHNHLRLFQFAICSLNCEIYAKDHLTWLTYVWPSTNPFLRTLVCELFKIPGFSCRRYFNRLVPTPFFGTRLRRQNFNLAPTQYRQLRRLCLPLIYVRWDYSKAGIRNDSLDQIWIWDLFFAYSLFFSKWWKVCISWNFSPILWKYQVRLKQPYYKRTCSLVTLLAESFFGRFVHWMYSTVKFSLAVWDHEWSL